MCKTETERSSRIKTKKGITTTLAQALAQFVPIRNHEKNQLDEFHNWRYFSKTNQPVVSSDMKDGMMIRLDYSPRAGVTCAFYPLFQGNQLSFFPFLY